MGGTAQAAGATVSGGSNFDGMVTGATVTGGSTLASLTLSNIVTTYNFTNTQPGGGRPW